jgi:hypothetical protein
MSYNKQLCYNDLTQNHEGAVAWRMTPEWELYTTVVTTMGTEDKFYEKSDDRVRRIADLVRKVDAEFVAQLAVYAREEMHLRSVPMLLLVELANCHRGDSLVSRAVSRTVQRADEITELLMCYQWRMGKENLHGLSSQLRKGLAEAFNRFDEYQFAKYNRTDRKVTLRDALLLVHPKPKDAAQGELFRKILNNSLETPYTWETELSAVGQRSSVSGKEKSEAKHEAWQQLVESRRMGYMATLRNLRNMLQLRLDDETMQMVCDYLANPDAVRKSKQLPFRFLSAYLELVGNRHVLFFQHPFQPQLNEVRKQIGKIERSMENWERGCFRVSVRKMKRYQTLGDLCLGSRVALPKELKYQRPTYHRRCREMVKTHLDNPSERYLLKQKYARRRLYGLKRRETALEKEMARGYMGRLERKWGENGIWAAQALEAAVRYTADNIRGFDKNTRVLLASDTSGSMWQSVSQDSSVMCYHIGLLLSMLMRSRCEDVIAGMFGDTWKACHFPTDNILQNTIEMMSRAGEVGYSTNGYKVIDWLVSENRVMDKVMLFTDCELWDSYNDGNHLSKSWEKYKEIAPDAKLYLFNLVGYGTSPVSMERDDVFCIAGWSDKVFDILAALENGENAIDMIRRIVV